MKKLISVIIPVYNVEKYLERCLDSVINQTYNNLEIICVNDCSPDNSIEILKKYQKLDSRIGLISNASCMGQAHTRSVGYQKAHGEFIYFLDSDDWIKEDFIEKMYKAIVEKNLPAVCCTNIKNVYPDGTMSDLLKRDFEEGFMPYTKSCMMAWSWLLKKDFLDKFDCIFPSGLKYEDNYFYNVLIRSLENVYIINSTQYYHYENPQSTMGKAKGRTIDNFDIIEVIDLVYENYKKTNKLSHWSIPFFYMPKYMLNIHTNKDEFFLKLKEFYKKIQTDVISNKQLYNQIELKFFNEIINSNNYSEYKKYQTSIIGALRQNVKEQNGRINQKV